MKYIYLLTLTLFLYSCSDEENLPTNVIESSDGLIIDLEWNTGSSSQQATADADIDLYLYLGDDLVASSEHFTTFESLALENHFKDGTYYIEVEYIEASGGNVDYTLYLAGQNNSNLKTYSSVFYPSDEGLNVRYLKIEKVDNQYTITDL